MEVGIDSFAARLTGASSEAALAELLERIEMILNWFDDLKQRVPTGR